MRDKRGKKVKDYCNFYGFIWKYTNTGSRGGGIGLGTKNQEIPFRYVHSKSPPGYPCGEAAQAVKIQVAGRERSGLQTQSWEVHRDDI